MAVWNIACSSMIGELGRFDADYFRPEYMANQEKLSGGTPMRNITKEIIHPGEFVRRYVQDGVLVVRTQNVRPMELSFGDNDVFIPLSVASCLDRNRLENNDILVTRTGANFGQCSLFLGERRSAIATSHTFILRTTNQIDPAYLTLFLNCRFGRTLLDQCAYGSAQPEISPKFLLGFPIPRLEDQYERILAVSVRKAYNLKEHSSNYFNEARRLFETELGIQEWSYRKPTGYLAQYNEIKTSNRFDAEHFYPAFFDFVSKLNSNIRLVHLDEHLLFCQRGKQPCYCKQGLPVINSKHVHPNRVSVTGNRQGIRGLKTDMDVRYGDLLLNGTGRGTIGRAAPYLEKTNAIPDNHVTILRTVGIDPVFLSYFLNSIAGQLQVEMRQRGSSGQLELYPFDIRKFLVWDAPNELQTEIRRLHEEAERADLESKRLLEDAIIRVEQLIEDAV